MTARRFWIFAASCMCWRVKIFRRNNKFPFRRKPESLRRSRIRRRRTMQCSASRKILAVARMRFRLSPEWKFGVWSRRARFHESGRLEIRLRLFCPVMHKNSITVHGDAIPDLRISRVWVPLPSSPYPAFTASAVIIFINHQHGQWRKCFASGDAVVVVAVIINQSERFGYPLVCQSDFPRQITVSDGSLAAGIEHKNIPRLISSFCVCHVVILFQPTN